jgi:hypothetical protein
MSLSAPTNVSYLPSALGISKVAQLNPSEYWYTTSVPSVILGTGIAYTVVAWVYFNGFSNEAACYSTGGSWGENVVFYLGPTGQGTTYGGSYFSGVVFPFSSTYGYLGVDEYDSANYSSAVPVYANQWVFLWWQYPGSGTTFYVGAIYGNNIQYTGSISLSYSLDVSATNYPAFFLNILGYGPTPVFCNSNGWIAYLAFYNVALSTSQIYAIYQGQRITQGLVMEYIGDNYDPSSGVWYDSSGNNVNLSSGTTPYPNRGCLLWPVGDSGDWMNWPTC